MASNPIQVITEIFSFLIRTGMETISFLTKKMLELFLSLYEISGSGMTGMIIASLVGGIMLFLILRYMLGSAKSLIITAIIFMIFLILILVSGLKF